MKKICLLCILIFSLVCALTSCAFIDGIKGNGEKDKDEFIVEFDTLSDYKIESITVKKGEKIPWFTPPTRDGYSFLCWYNGDKIWSFSSDAVTSDMTLTASYVANEYTITYDLSGGRLTSSPKDTYTPEDDDYVLPKPKNGNLIFDSWFLDGKPVDTIPSGTYGNLTLVAAFYSDKPTIIYPDNTNSADIRVYAINEQGKIKVKAISSQDAEITVRVKVPEEWHYVGVEQITKRSYLISKTEGVNKVVDIKINTNNDAATLSAVSKTTDGKLVSGYGITLSNGTVVDKNYFPGFVRKSVTFTLDDGIYQYDKKVVEILKNVGFKGTFNINNPASVSDPSIYEGFEVANHHILHAVAMKDNYAALEIVEEFLPENADRSKVYLKSQTIDGKQVEGLYYVFIGNSWHPLASNDTYTEYLKWTEIELEKIFGEGSIVGFAYPHGNQYNDAVIEYLKSAGYLYGRRTGNLKGTTGFALPKDRFTWTYNADHNCLNEVMAEYDAYEDDGELKMFSFGVHAKDFETYAKWGELIRFANLYGNRSEDFWYASNREIFEYEDALNELIITDEKIVNDSDVDIFVTINGERTIIFANSEYIFN